MQNMCNFIFNFQVETNANKIFKMISKFKKLVQNIKRTMVQISHRKKQIWTVLDCPVYCLRTITRHIILFKLNEFKKCIKRRNKTSATFNHIP